MAHDINRLPTDGYLIVPLSMSRLQTGQSPDACYEILEYFEPKIQSYGVDVVFLYTNGLYFNTADPALDVRKYTNKIMLDHKNGLQKRIIKKRKFMPQAVHYLPWDYALLNIDNFNDEVQKLRKAFESDEALQQAVMTDLMGRGGDEANIEFILEEVVATHFMRQKMIELPKTLVKKDGYRLIIYPGMYIQADAYQYANRILATNPELRAEDFPFASGHYDYSQKMLFDFRDLAQATRENVVNFQTKPKDTLDNGS